MEKIEKKILIIGNTAKDNALINKIKDDIENVKFFITSNSKVFINPNIEYIDIREDNPEELLTFAVSNNIDLTIITSQKALKADITSYFQENQQAVFAPTYHACELALDKAYCKKYLYKHKIPTPKFAIYEKEQLALEYLKDANYPVIISCASTDKGRDRFACPTNHIAKTFTEDLFFRGENKVVIEDYVYGHEFTFYTITDGYAVLPITTVANYKFLKEGDGGLLTSGIGCFCEDYKISAEIKQYLLEILNNVLLDLQAENTPYTGILGVDCVLKRNGEVSILEFTPFFKDHDCNAVLNLIDNNIVELFEACINGYFADEYNKLNISEKSSVACSIMAKKDDEKIVGLENIENSTITLTNIKIKNDQYFTSKDQQLILTCSANTLNRAKNNLYEDAKNIDFKGITYRKDICSN